MEPALQNLRSDGTTPLRGWRKPSPFARSSRAVSGSILLRIVSFSAVLAFAGCGAQSQTVDEQPSWSRASLQEAVGESLSAPPASPPEGYRLGEEDVLNILVYGEPDLTTVARVGKDGSIVMPLIGSVQAAGVTPEELKQSIEAGLRAGYLVNPDVQIILQQYRQEMVHLFGQVGTPGPFRITHQDTLMEIISKAGGFTPIANRKKIKIIRREESGSRVILINAARITDEGRLEEDVPLRPGDVIIVPERFF